MSQNLQTILELQQALSQLRDAEKRLHGIPDWMRELHQEHETRKAEIAVLEETAEEATRQRRAAEAAVQDSQEKLKKYQQQINKVSTQREYGALLQEIDTVKGQITAGEEQALSSLDISEKAQKPGIAKQAEGLKARIATLRQQLPRGVVANFERILERYPGGAVAPVRIIERPGQKQREWHCTACTYRVRPQVVVEIRNEGTKGHVIADAVQFVPAK